jgi:transcription elongation factor Elf1
MTCPWCGHSQCENCNEELNRIFPNLFFGCEVCGSQAQLQAYNLIESRREST